MDKRTHFLKVVPSARKEESQVDQDLNPLARFQGVVQNLTESALDHLNRISQREMEKNSPSATLMEEYFLLHHYLDFIKRICQKKRLL